MTPQMYKLVNVNIKKVDLQLDSELVPIYFGESDVKVPKFRNIPEFYRSRLSACQRKLGKTIPKKIRDADERSKRSTSPSPTETPKKRTRKKKEEESEEESNQGEESEVPATPHLSEADSDFDWSDE